MEEAIQSIDALIKQQLYDIEESHAKLLTLKTRRNTLVPIYSLPPEILSNIFAFAQDRQLHYTDGHRTGDQLNWLSLTRVCRYWRDIALDSPNLWIDLPVQYPLWVEAMIKRSKDCDLIVDDADIPASDNLPHGLILALQNTHRIRELSIFPHSPNMWGILQDTCSASLRSAPRLKRLHLEGRKYSPLSISEVILCETGPLSQLELINCFIDWSLHPLLRCPLTHLKLHNQWPEGTPSGKEFIAALKGMPDLQVLDLKQSLPNRTVDESNSYASEQLHLAHLRTLRIQSSYCNMQDFLHCVTFPPTAHVEIKLYQDFAPEYSATFHELARSYSSAGPDTIFQSLILERAAEYPTTNVQRLKFYTERLQESAMLNHIENTAHLELVFSLGRTNRVEPLLESICNSGLNLRYLRIVHFSEDLASIRTTMLTTTFGNLPRIQAIVAAGQHAWAFLRAIRLEAGSYDANTNIPGSPRSALPFPSVSSICLYGLNFVKISDTEVFERGMCFIETLQDTLNFRRKIGAPIEKLTLWRCRNLSEEDIELLQEIVADVDWGESPLTP